jgi:shikimate kinase
MEMFSQKGTVVYLKASMETLSARLRDLKGRGVVVREGQSLEDIYKERTRLYEKYAGLIVEEDGKNLEETLDAVMEAVSGNH